MVIARLTTVRASLSLLVNGQAEYFRGKGHLYYLASGPCEHVIDDNYYTELPLTRRPKIFNDFLALIRTYYWLKTIRPDILHTHTPKAGLIGMVAGFFARVPVRLHTVAGLPWIDSTGVKRIFFKSLEALAYKFATTIYPNSYGLKSYLENEIPSAKSKFKVLGNGSSNGIDTDYFSKESILASKNEIRLEFKIPIDSFVWVYIGRIVKDKGIDELVKAFSEQKSNQILLLVGPFEDEQDPVSDKTKREIQENERILTYGFQKDIRPFLKLSDALVFPSYREGFPNVPLQAAAMSLPQIVTDINGCNEIVINNLTGIIIPPKDSLSLSNAMHKLADDSVLRVKMSLNSRVSIANRFDRKHMWSLIEEEYQILYKKYVQSK